MDDDDVGKLLHTFVGRFTDKLLDRFSSRTCEFSIRDASCGLPHLGGLRSLAGMCRPPTHSPALSLTAQTHQHHPRLTSRDSRPERIVGVTCASVCAQSCVQRREHGRALQPP